MPEKSSHRHDKKRPETIDWAKAEMRFVDVSDDDIPDPSRKVYEMGEGEDGRTYQLQRPSSAPTPPKGGWKSPDADNPPFEPYVEQTTPEDEGDVTGIEDLAQPEEASRAAEMSQPLTADTEASGNPDDETGDSLIDAAYERTKQRHHERGNDTIEDLVHFDDFKLRGHVDKGLGRYSGSFMSQKQLDLVQEHQDKIRGGLGERHKENELFKRAKELVSILDSIEASLAASDGSVSDPDIVRQAIESAKLFGDNTDRTLRVLPDDDIMTVLDYARGIAPKSPAHQPLPALNLPVGGHQPLPALDLPAGGSHQPLPALNLPVGSHQPLPSLDLPVADPELTRLRAELDAARSDWALRSSKRHRHMFGRESDAYLADKIHYTRLSQEVARRELSAALAAETDMAQKYALIDAHWITEQNKLRDEAKKTLEGRWVWKKAKMFSDFMNRGPLAWRIAKGAALGLTGAAIGMATFGLGTAGAAGAALATRFGRGYAVRVTGGVDHLSNDAIDQIKQQRSLLGDTATDEELISHRSKAYEEQYDEDGRALRKRRRGTLYRTVGFAAAGLAGGSLLHHLIGSGNTHGTLGKRSGGLVPKETTPDNGGSGVVPGSGDVTPGGGDGAGPGAGPTGGTAGDLPRVSQTPDAGRGIVSAERHYGGDGRVSVGSPDQHIPTGHDLLHPHDVYHVHAGEGWYETFQDMGIPKDKWADVLKDAGPKLHKLGVAYFDQAHHQWYISRPGTLSRQAIQAIADSSAKFGYAFAKLS